jgi:hypothetical protein
MDSKGKSYSLTPPIVSTRLHRAILPCYYTFHLSTFISRTKALGTLPEVSGSPQLTKHPRRPAKPFPKLSSLPRPVFRAIGWSGCSISTQRARESRLSPCTFLGEGEESVHSLLPICGAENLAFGHVNVKQYCLERKTSDVR